MVRRFFLIELAFLYSFDNFPPITKIFVFIYWCKIIFFMLTIHDNGGSCPKEVINVKEYT